MATFYSCVKDVGAENFVFGKYPSDGEEVAPDDINRIFAVEQFVIADSVVETSPIHRLLAIRYNLHNDFWVYPTFAVVDNRVVITSIVAINGTYKPNFERVLAAIEFALISEL